MVYNYVYLLIGLISSMSSVLPFQNSDSLRNLIYHFILVLHLAGNDHLIYLLIRHPLEIIKGVQLGYVLIILLNLPFSDPKVIAINHLICNSKLVTILGNFSKIFKN